MKTDYVVLHPSVAEPLRFCVDIPEVPGYDRLKKLVEPYLGGANMEHVTVLNGDTRTDMFVDEIGALKNLQVNERATAIYHAATKKHAGLDADTKDWPKIHGPAVLFSRRVWY